MSPTAPPRSTLPRGHVTLERALSKLGLASRREARAWIAAGRVRVGGRVERDPLRALVPERAEIEIDGRGVVAAAPLLVMLNKPRGVVTTRRDPQGRPTVYDHLAGLDAHVVPVGRLDAASTGLLLLTSDTRFADWLTDPRQALPRRYAVTVRGRVTAEELAILRGGIADRDEELRPTAVELRKASERESHLLLELREGKNREVRRLLAAVGHEVTRLLRVAFGGLALGGLQPGCWRLVDEAEIGRTFPGSPWRGAERR